MSKKIKATLKIPRKNCRNIIFQIYKNFQNACRSLKTQDIKKARLMKSEQKFECIGFSEKLDTNPNLKGVANGIVELGKKV